MENIVYLMKFFFLHFVVQFSLRVNVFIGCSSNLVVVDLLPFHIIHNNCLHFICIYTMDNMKEREEKKNIIETETNTENTCHFRMN